VQVAGVARERPSAVYTNKISLTFRGKELCEL
jgi:hypothetical protein